MAHGFLNYFLTFMTAAERAAYTPDPPTVATGQPAMGYVVFETDTGKLWLYNGSALVEYGATDAELAALAGLVSAANKIPRFTGSGTADLLDFDTDDTLAADSDTRIASQKAIKAYVDAQVGGVSLIDDAVTDDDTTWSSEKIAAGLAAVSAQPNQPAANGLVSGGGFVNTTGLIFEVSAASYFLDGELIESAGQSVTLDAADATHPRLDVLVLDDTGTLQKITGTAAATPSQPAYDPNTQLFLTFVLVPATETTLSGISTTNIYLENTEWTATTSGSGFDANSTTDPYSGSKAIEGTAVTAASYVKLVAGAPFSFDGEGNLAFRIKSKATWNSKRSLQISWRLSGVSTGLTLTLKSGAYGFDSSQTSAYQLVVIPKSDFAVPAGVTVDELRIVDAGGAIGFHIDEIKLQNVGTTTSPPTAPQGITQAEADARYARRANNLSDLSSASTARTNLSVYSIAQVDALIAGGASVTVDDSAPGSPAAGDLWWDSESGRLKIYYDDGSSSQWVDASPSIAGADGVDGVDGVDGTDGAYGPHTPSTIAPPTTSTFTLVEGVASSATMTDTDRGVKLAIVGASGADRNGLLEVTPPGSTWTMKAQITPGAWFRNYLTIGLYVKDATGKIHAFCHGYNSGLTGRQTRWTNITTFSTSTDFSTLIEYGPLFYKLVLDGTNLTFSLSIDDVNYLQLYQVAKGAFVGTITKAGVMFGLTQAAAPTGITEGIHVTHFEIA